MRKIRTIKDYIEYNFINELWEAAEEFISRHQDPLYRMWSRTHRYGKIEIQDVEVKFVRSSDLPGMKIHCDVVIEVTYAFPEAEYRDIEKAMWLVVGAEGDLDHALKDLEFGRAEEYSGKKRQENPMDDALVPVIGKDTLDKEAVRFLEAYYPEALKRTLWVDPCAVAERMGLTIRYADITADRSIFGRIFFYECETELYDAKTGEICKEKIPAGTILVDKEAAFLRGYEAINNTIIHECVHWYKHRKAFMLAKLYDDSLTSIGCSVTGGVVGNKTESVEWMEWQANAITPRIQVPLNALKTLVHKFISTGNDDWDTVDSIEHIIEDVSITFSVSRFSAKLRLLEAGVKEAAGAFTYIDGRYVRPHTVSEGYQLESNKTFSIGAKDAAILSLTNDALREELAKGLYQYVDGHFVLKHEKFVEFDERGSLRLTRYALRHMEECCLIFELSVKGEYGKEYRSACFLNRDQGSPIIFEYKFRSGYEGAPENEKQQLLTDTVNDAVELFQSLPNNYALALKLCIEWRNKWRKRNAEKQPGTKFNKITVKEIADNTGLNDITVRRTLRGEKTSLNTLVLICLALHLPGIVSLHIIENSPYPFDLSKDDHRWYQFVLLYYNGYKVDEIKDFLAKQGAAPL